MGGKGLLPEVILRWGPIEVTATVGYSLLVSDVLVGFAVLVRRGPPAFRTAAEFIVEHLEGVMRDLFGCDPAEYVPLVVTLALYVGASNLLGLLPGMQAPTADFSTDAALAVLVFVAVPFYGLRARGLRGYLGHYLEPSPFLLPLEVITELSRTLALAVRLFGNVFSEELIIAVLLTIAGLLIPVPLMMLAVLTGVIQAYIFAVLTVVYLGAAVRAKNHTRRESP
jgi:F-type H+-transporting ATPase subunit a